MPTSSDIRLTVDMDDSGVEAIRWQADDSPEPGVHAAGAMILALWDQEKRNALRIDLWVKDLSVDDMNDFLFQTVLSVADTYKKATNDAGLASEIKLFARDFAEKASRAAHAHARRAGAPRSSA